MSLPSSYQALIDAFDQLPGIGPNAAERICQHLLKNGSQDLLLALQKAQIEIHLCTICQMFSASQQCAHCLAAKQEALTEMLVVANAGQQQAILQSGFKGIIFVLHGLLSPIAGVGPNELGIDKLLVLVNEDAIQKITIITGASAEGMATQQFIKSLLGSNRHCQSMTMEQWQSQNL